MKYTDFSDERIHMVERRGSTLTPEERAFLEVDTLRFEENTATAEELQKMSDADLMYHARCVWSDYASGQI